MSDAGEIGNRGSVEGLSISVVVPVYNEVDVLAEFHRRLGDVLAHIDVSAEVLYVNDGSVDRTASLLRELQSGDDRVAIIELTRNFGKEVAMTAGLDAATADAVVVIDADLQDPPELIPALIQRWREGYDVVTARRARRDGDTWLKKTTAKAFYRLIQHVGRVRIPEETGDFRLLSRRAVESLRQLREHHRFMKGLFAWIGYPQIDVSYDRSPRFAGASKWNYWRLWNFALEGITSFTIAPLKVASYLGVTISLAAFIYALVILGKTILYGDPVKGYPSLMVVVLFLGGVQLLFIGVVGEYLGRVFNEVKARPLYLISEYRPSALVRHRTEDADRDAT